MATKELGSTLGQAREGAIAVPVPLAKREINPKLVRVASLVAGLILWEIVARQVNPLFASYPTAIAIAFWEMLRSGELVTASLTSFQSLLIGYFLAAIIGIVLGLVMGRYRIVEWALDSYVNALYATPLVAFIPLIILWVGLGFSAKVTVVFILTLFPVLINTLIGVRNVSNSLVEVGQAFVANERQIFLKIILPATVPYVMGGLRLGIGRAIIGMVVAEFFTAITGLGALIINYANFFKTDRMFVPIVVLMVLGIGLTEIVKVAEQKIAPWKETERAQA